MRPSLPASSTPASRPAPAAPPVAPAPVNILLVDDEPRNLDVLEGLLAAPEHRLVRANVNVGLATFPEDHLYPKELMILADQRMRQDRELRRAPQGAA